MARPKEFDVDEALEQAMHLFWESGYEATSMSDLVTRLGIARQSLYDTFGDKHAIYLAALERWQARQKAELKRLLANDEPIRAVLRRLLETTIEQDLAGDCARGCMMVNAAVERGTSDEKVRALLCDNGRFLEDCLLRRLHAAQERGEIGAHHDPVALARFFSCILSGLRITSKTTRDRRALEDIVRVTLGVLG